MPLSRLLVAISTLALTEVDIRIQQPIVVTHSQKLLLAVKAFFMRARDVELVKAQISHLGGQAQAAAASQLRDLSASRSRTRISLCTSALLLRIPENAHDKHSRLAVVAIREFSVATPLQPEDSLTEAYTLALKEVCVSLAPTPQAWEAEK
jgi:hypothetical protein